MGDSFMYTIRVKDADGNMIDVEVKAEIYEIYEESKKKSWNEEKSDRYHLADLDVDQIWVYTGPSTEEYVELREKIEVYRSIIDTCTNLQKRRFYLHFLHGLSQREIADLEGCTQPSVAYAINTVLQKIKKFKKKTL